jgi:hypothetical protein
LSDSRDPFDFSDSSAGEPIWDTPAEIVPNDDDYSIATSPATATSLGSGQPNSAPFGFLIAGSLAVVAAFLLLMTSGSNPVASFVAWVLAGPVSFTMVGFFLGTDAQRRSEAYYVEQTWTKPLMYVVAIAGFVLVVTSAWFFADWAARQ